MDRNGTSDVYIFISEDVISKVRNEFVFNGELEESVLSEIQANWIRRMIQVGAVNGTVERSSASVPTPPATPDHNPLPAESGIDIDAQFPRSSASTDLVMSTKNELDGMCIPQLDGANDGDIVAEPNTNAPPKDEDDDESLNEDDDVDEVDAIGADEETPHMVLCQFNHVKRRNKSIKWWCDLKAGVMLINGKNLVFSTARGDFHF